MSHVAAVSVGRMGVLTVCEGFAALPLSGELPGVEIDWEAERAEEPWAFHGDDAWPWHVHAFVVDGRSGPVVVDTGLGPFPPYAPWVSSQPDAWSGVEPSSVRDVIVTHLHADHAGGAVVDGAPRFPNARYHVHGMDWAHFAGAEDAADYVARQAMRALEESGQLVVDMVDREISPGVQLLHTPGHTPGHRSVLLSDGDERLVLTGDALHLPAQVAFAAEASSHDEDALLGAASRRLLLWRAGTYGWGVAVSHFAEPFGRVEKGSWISRAG